MALDKNIAALLDENAYTIRVVYPVRTNSAPQSPQKAYEANSSAGREYTFVANIQPKLKAGDSVIVTSQNNAYFPRNYAIEKPLVPAVATEVDALDWIAPASINTQNYEAYAVCLVVGVDKDVRIEPGDDIKYKWVVGKLDTTGYEALCERNETIHEKLAVAYKNNIRRSFSSQILGGLPEGEQAELMKLLGK